jgi:hypothetical protein
LTEKALYLENTYSLFDNSSQSKLLLKEAIDKAFENNKINLKVQEDCLSLYIFFSGLCTVYLELEDYDRYFTCMATADAILLACLGIP